MEIPNANNVLKFLNEYPIANLEILGIPSIPNLPEEIVKQLKDTNKDIHGVFTNIILQIKDEDTMKETIQAIKKFADNIDLRGDLPKEENKLKVYLAKLLLKRRAAHLYTLCLFKLNAMKVSDLFKKIDCKKEQNENKELQEAIKEYQDLIDNVIPQIASWHEL